MTAKMTLMTIPQGTRFGTLNPHTATQAGLSLSGYYRIGVSVDSPKTGTLTRVRVLTQTVPDANMRVFTYNPNTNVVVGVSAAFTFGNNQVDFAPNIPVNAGDRLGFYFPNAGTKIVYGTSTGTFYYEGYNSVPVVGAGVLIGGTWDTIQSPGNPLVEGTVA